MPRTANRERTIPIRPFPETTSHDGNIRLINGECVEVMRTFADQSFDLVLTDPPYCAAVKGSNSKQSTATKYTSSDAARQFTPFEGDYRDQRSFTIWCAIWMQSAFRLVRDGGAIISFIDHRNICCVIDAVQCAGFIYDGIVPWIKPAGRPRLGWYQTSQSEFAVVARKGAVDRRERKCGPKALFDSAPQKRIHPTQKPVDALQQLFSFRSDWESILDPFAGGATTLVAAALAGRRAVGIELSKHYYASACERLREAETATRDNDAPRLKIAA